MLTREQFEILAKLAEKAYIVKDEQLSEWQF